MWGASFCCLLVAWVGAHFCLCLFCFSHLSRSSSFQCRLTLVLDAFKSSLVVYLPKQRFLIEDAVGIFHPLQPQDALFWLLFLLLWWHLKLPSHWRPTIHITFSQRIFLSFLEESTRGGFWAFQQAVMCFPRNCGQLPSLAVWGRRFSTTILSKFFWLAIYSSWLLAFQS